MKLKFLDKNNKKIKINDKLVINDETDNNDDEMDNNDILVIFSFGFFNNTLSFFLRDTENNITTLYLNKFLELDHKKNIIKIKGEKFYELKI